MCLNTKIGSRRENEVENSFKHTWRLWWMARWGWGWGHEKLGGKWKFFTNANFKISVFDGKYVVLDFLFLQVYNIENNLYWIFQFHKIF